MAAFESACQAMRQKGVVFDVIKNATPRMYYSEQAAQVGQCDMVLRLKNSRYDVGFKRQDNGDLVPVFDGWDNDIRNTGIGTAAACPIPNSPAAQEQAHIGSFMQEYSKHAAINAATANGYMVESVETNPETGEQTLVLTH